MTLEQRREWFAKEIARRLAISCPPLDEIELTEHLIEMQGHLLAMMANNPPARWPMMAMLIDQALEYSEQQTRPN
jgi:hypothetical protein